jgi:hypothetical protein
METIFDHNVTPDELIFLFGKMIDKNEYLSYPTSEDSENGALFHLYVYRKDNSTAQKFLSKVKDKQYAFDLQLNDVIVEPAV